MKILYKKAIRDGLNITLIPEHQTKEDLRLLYSKSKMYLLLSRWEGTNRAAKEAIFCNTPVMAIKNTCAAETHINNYTGKAVEDDPEVIAREIIDMLDNYRSYSPREWALKHRPRRYVCEKIWEAINKIQRYPGFPDMDAANEIRKQFAKNKYDNYSDLNNYKGKWWPRLTHENIVEITDEFGSFV